MNELIVKLDGTKNKVEFYDDRKVTLNGKEYEYEIFENKNNLYFLRIDKNIYNFTCVENKNDLIILFAKNHRYEITVRTSLQEKAIELLSKSHTIHHKLEIRAPMPGLILKVMKNKGEQVINGEPVMILEAMKMENEIRSSANGIIKDILVNPGSTVEKGAVLYTIEN